MSPGPDRAPPGEPALGFGARRALWLGLALVLLGTAALRWRLLGVPLERDEGEYAYAGQLLLSGHAPFDGAYNMKLPGIYALYAVVMAVFGQTDVGIHLGLLLASLVTSVLVFRLGARLFDPWSGLAAAALYGLLALSSRVQGMFANSEHFVVPFALGGVLVLLGALGDSPSSAPGRGRRLFLGGCLLGAAFLVKQHALAFLPLGAALVAGLGRGARRERLGALALYAAGVLLPYALTVLVCLVAGTFDEFWLWTFTFARDYVGLVDAEQGLRNLATNGGALVRSAWGASALALVGLAALVRGHEPRRARWSAAGFVLASAAATTPGLYFRPHYFVLLLPAAALLAGRGAMFVAGLARLAPTSRAWLRPALALGLTLGALGEIVTKQRGFLFRYAPDQIARALYGPSPFPEARVIGQWIRQNTAPDARVAALCSEPQMYFYARRRASTGFLYLYALMETSALARRLQRDLIAEFEAHPPEILITTPSRDSFADYPGTWPALRRAHPEFFAWIERTLAGYELVGVADVPARGPTTYRFGAETRGYESRSPFAVLVHRRR